VDGLRGMPPLLLALASLTAVRHALSRRRTAVQQW
jgi:hypothetical protein